MITQRYGYRKVMRLCTLHNYYAPVSVPESDEIMHPAQVLCTRMARKVMRLCTLHNYYAPVRLPQSEEIMHPAQLLCTRMATGK